MSLSWASILGFFSGLVSLVSKILEQLKMGELLNIGRRDQQAEIAKEEAETTRKQAEIMLEKRTIEDTEKRLRDGTF